MEVGTLQGVVEYRLGQKLGWLRASHYFYNPQVKLWKGNPKLQSKLKRLPGTVEKCLHSTERFGAVKGRKPITIFWKRS